MEGTKELSVDLNCHTNNSEVETSDSEGAKNIDNSPMNVDEVDVLNKDMEEETDCNTKIHSTQLDTEKGEVPVPESLSKDEEDMYKEITEDGWEDILGSGRLKKRIIKEGKKGLASDGLGRPSRNDEVTISIKGFFQDTMFEENDELKFFAAEAEVIQAIDLVAVLMNVDEIAEVIADPELAYGSTGLPPHVPPKAAVRFEIRLIAHSAPVVPSDMPLADRSLIGKRKRERGNFWFSRGDYTSAVQCYRKAGEFFDDEKLDLEVPIDRYELSIELQNLLDDRLKAYNNLAMAQMKIHAWDSAMASLQQVLRIEPNNEKALYRKSKVLLQKYRPEEALGILRRISRLYPNNSSAKADIIRLSTKQKQSREKEEKISKKMLGLDKYEAEKAKEKWYIKYFRNGIFSEKNAVIGLSAVLFAAVGTAAYYTQFHV